LQLAFPDEFVAQVGFAGNVVTDTKLDILDDAEVLRQDNSGRTKRIRTSRASGSMFLNAYRPWNCVR
jgi:hypothetical protein